MKAKIYNLIILDKSGSMETIRQEAINGFNETLGTIQAAQKKYSDTQEQYVTLATFCTCGTELKYDKVPAEEAQKLHFKDYTPCCGTPLLDAIGTTVQQLRNDIKDDKQAGVLVTIITDGEENSSKEWTWTGITKLIDELKEEGWMFSFIGSDQSTIEVATKISISNVLQFKSTPQGTKVMFDKENSSRDRYYCMMSEGIEDLNLAEPGTADTEKGFKDLRKKMSNDYFKKK